MLEPLHPAIVHLPLGLAVVVPLLALGLTVALWREWLPRRAWIVAVLLQAVLFGSALLASSSGERDEEAVEQVVAETAIEAHEEAAAVFTWGAGIALAATAVVLLLKSPVARRWGALGATAATAVVALLAVRVGHAGGELVYRHGAAAAHTAAAPATPAGPADPGPRAEPEAAEAEDD
jgi:hypothetical protein